jgi:hypothetical protein
VEFVRSMLSLRSQQREEQGSIIRHRCAPDEKRPKQ